MDRNDLRLMAEKARALLLLDEAEQRLTEITKMDALRAWAKGAGPKNYNSYVNNVGDGMAMARSYWQKAIKDLGVVTDHAAARKAAGKATPKKSGRGMSGMMAKAATQPIPSGPGSPEWDEGDDYNDKVNTTPEPNDPLHLEPQELSLKSGHASDPVDYTKSNIHYDSNGALREGLGQALGKAANYVVQNGIAGTAANATRGAMGALTTAGKAVFGGQKALQAKPAKPEAPAPAPAEQPAPVTPSQPTAIDYSQKLPRPQAFDAQWIQLVTQAAQANEAHKAVLTKLYQKNGDDFFDNWSWADLAGVAEMLGIEMKLPATINQQNEATTTPSNKTKQVTTGPTAPQPQAQPAASTTLSPEVLAQIRTLLQGKGTKTSWEELQKLVNQ
jgi:hypothetical protein